MGRVSFALAAALLLAVVTAGSALAGGWAVTTLDATPAVLAAGRTHRIGYTIRQHGVQPIDVARFGGTTEIVARSADTSRQLSFPGRPDGATGHFVAEVTLSPGRWNWEVTQGPFQPQPLGDLVVEPPPAVAAPSAPARLGFVPPPFLAPLMVAASVAVVAAMLLADRRQGRVEGGR